MASNPSNRIADASRTAVRASVLTIDSQGVHHRVDHVAAEEPLEIRVADRASGRQHAIAVTMRTPGHDHDLAAGFLLTEGIITAGREIAELVEARRDDDRRPANVLTAFLTEDASFDPERFRRNVYTSSSCGVCGRASIERVQVACDTLPRGDTPIGLAELLAMPSRLRDAQAVFARTGGLHAAGLFSPDGALCCVREDVGRHNAVDKLVGACLRDNALPATDTVLMVSGRASYELVQKAVLAGIPTLAAVGAPSSLAIDLARAYGLTLVGFLRESRFNLYTAPHRIALEPRAAAPAASAQTRGETW